jgi:hypothetical protein
MTARRQRMYRRISEFAGRGAADLAEAFLVPDPIDGGGQR